MIDGDALLREYESHISVKASDVEVYTVSEMIAPDNQDDWHGEWYDHEMDDEPHWDDPQWVARFLDGDWAQWAEHGSHGEISLGVVDSFETGVLFILKEMYDLCGEAPAEMYVSAYRPGNAWIVALRDGWAQGRRAKRFLILRERVYQAKAPA